MSLILVFNNHSVSFNYVLLSYCFNIMSGDQSAGELAYLCIYNPTLDPSESNLPHQIVFYHGQQNNEPTPIQEQLKHIGLAQGVVEFTKYV